MWRPVPARGLRLRRMPRRRPPLCLLLGPHRLAPGPVPRPDLTRGSQSRIPTRRPATTEGRRMAMYWKEITVNWGESDPFGLVYYPRIVAWFNDTEHELFRVIGFPIEQMIQNDRTTFVMGEIHFRFIGPAAYGDRVTLKIMLTEIHERTLHWECSAKLTLTGAQVTEGKATRVYARINEDGTLSSAPIPEGMRRVLASAGAATSCGPKSKE